VGAVACSTDSGWEGHGKDMNGIYFFNFKVKILSLFLTVMNLNSLYVIESLYNY
jgi:hypothetical protein